MAIFFPAKPFATTFKNMGALINRLCHHFLIGVDPTLHAGGKRDLLKRESVRLAVALPIVKNPSGGIDLRCGHRDVPNSVWVWCTPPGIKRSG